MSTCPKVFVSYASEDFDRFVDGFGKALRRMGIAAWVGEWEIGPGDSLVEKIFEKGLSKADTVIVVVSEWSVNKPWVQEELNYAKGRQVAKQVKLIPVIIDECAVPPALASTVYVKIRDIHDYQPQLSKIIASILGEDNRPPLGEAPAYSGPALYHLGGSSNIDNHVLNLLCRMALEGDSNCIRFQDLVTAAESLQLDRIQVRDSSQILAEDGYVSIFRTLGGPQSVTVKAEAILTYFRTTRSDFLEVQTQLLPDIVNFGAGAGNETSIAQMQYPPGSPAVMAEAILDYWESRGMFKRMRQWGRGQEAVSQVSPRLSRMLSAS
ncbi:MAG: TIR domain-containing protein [Thermomicrobiales bacterium]